MRWERALTPILVDSAKVLALLRIVVPVVILVSPELHDAPFLAAHPDHLRYPPEGLRTLAAALPIGPGLARVLQVVAFSSAATAILGFKSRASMLALTIAGGLLFSLSQRSGAVLHDMHLFWMTSLLAASPCGDAWSLDAWGAPPPAPSKRYGVPLAFARIFLGLVYFFPGLHKLATSGLGWLTAGNAVGHMQAKWLEHGAVPPIRIDEHPWLCTIGAIFVVAFELSFLFLAVAGPRTRIVALAGGVVFHLSTQLLFFIPFTALWACYVVLLPTLAIDRGAPDREARPARAPVAVGLFVALFAIVQGIRGQTQAWPFACYPTFAHVQPHEIPDVLVEVTLRDGAVRALTGREQAIRSQADWGRVFRSSGAYGDAPDAAALRAHANEVIASASPPLARAEIERVRVLRVMVPTAPARWRETPSAASGVLLTEWRETTR